MLAPFSGSGQCVAFPSINATCVTAGTRLCQAGGRCYSRAWGSSAHPALGGPGGQAEVHGSSARRLAPGPGAAGSFVPWSNSAIWRGDRGRFMAESGTDGLQRKPETCRDPRSPPVGSPGTGRLAGPRPGRFSEAVSQPAALSPHGTVPSEQGKSRKSM